VVGSQKPIFFYLVMQSCVSERKKRRVCLYCGAFVQLANDIAANNERVGGTYCQDDHNGVAEDWTKPKRVEKEARA
jgi:hypothetical protein